MNLIITAMADFTAWDLTLQVCVTPRIHLKHHHCGLEMINAFTGIPRAVTSGDTGTPECRGSASGVAEHLELEWQSLDSDRQF